MCAMNTAGRICVRGRVPRGSKTCVTPRGNSSPTGPRSRAGSASVAGAAPSPLACPYPTWTAVQAFATVRYAVLPLPYRAAAAFRVPARAPL